MIESIFKMRVSGTLLLVLTFCPFHAFAQTDERILSFHSDIGVHEDASATVKETIHVRAQGNQIRRGIYRDFPMPVKIEQVLRNEAPDGYHLEKQGRGIRLYVGRENYMLPPGEYTYTIVYRVEYEAVRFFEDHDEVYWNVTGNEWAFPIDETSASITFPVSLAEHEMIAEAYTGPEGATGADYEVVIDGPGKVSFHATRLFGAGEGSTVVVSFPKGVVIEPSALEKFVRATASGTREAIAAGGLVVVFIFYCIVWALIGKDPLRGRIMPTDHPPEKLSPAAMRYIKEMGFDKKIFTVALINMAVKGYIRIEQDKDDTYTLVRDQANENILTPEEQQLAKELFLGKYDSIELEQRNHAKLAKAIAAFQKALKRRYATVYFVTNGKFFAPGILLSLLILVAAVASGSGAEFATAGFMCVWLSIWTIAVIALVGGAFSAWKTFLTSPSLTNFGGAIGLTLFSIPFAAGEGFGLFMLSQASSVIFTLLLVAHIVMAIIFYQLLKAPTLLGRQFLDQVEGFAMYLNGEGGTRFGLSGDTAYAERYEQYLPYAVALGNEASWSKGFEEALANSTHNPTNDYTPMWYSGQSYHSLGHSGFANSLGGAFSSAVSSASTSPSSSGSGGGGSSGGGGGGGGGGW